ncbi:Target of EGR1, member 1 (Nuclear) [Clydaea vesicula]|uniref:Target of EGR1, member 1 (Nuclear) n=1 Tax=Clydaea vesicula TaxID=447962 RepID=A0AAD5U7H7_9FUNG|nr:Target of EGR1, member 1 (Nuclear) [Clydaea vesicula]KAJ3394637.1 Target of EGR1, member 1 (Nuclear) [Lobulomyces angularis]
MSKLSKSTLPTPTIPNFNEVNRFNVQQLQLVINHLITNADFVSVDCEFTGLGENKLTKAPNIEERYGHLSKLVKSHAIVAFGLSIFEKGTENKNTFKVNNFNFTMLCSKEFNVNHTSLSFLVDNGFDFNNQFINGIFYTPGEDKMQEKNQSTKKYAFNQECNEEIMKQNNAIRSIFSNLLNKPNLKVVIHNGLLDLMFLYHSFYTDLPLLFSTFITDLTQMFQGGIYDTKYISEFGLHREESSFLAYLFRNEREQLDFKFSNKAEYLTCEVQNRLSLPSSFAKKEETSTKEVDPQIKSGKRKTNEVDKPYCENYANHGYCKLNKKCSKTHDLDTILDFQFGESELKKSKKLKSAKILQQNTQAEKNEVENGEKATLVKNVIINNVGESTEIERKNNFAKIKEVEDKLNMLKKSLPTYSAESTVERTKVKNPFENYHSACFDAFMTAFVFSHQRFKYEHFIAGDKHLTKKETDFEFNKNKIYLMGKDFPLKIEKSMYSKFSSGHLKKWNELFG